MNPQCNKPTDTILTIFPVWGLIKPEEKEFCKTFLILAIIVHKDL
jgi:hypothetical protein